MRTLITFILAILCSTSIALADTYTGTTGDCTYTLDTDEGTLVISGSGAMADYSQYSYAPWYSYLSDIKTVTIVDGVTNIGEYAFFNCSSLTSVTIPDGVTSIGSYAFYSCSSLTSITIPDGVTSIGAYAFAHVKTSLTSVTIGSGVTSIGEYAFYDCTGLTNFTVGEGNTAYVSVDGVLYTYDMTELICYPAQKTDTSYTIPDGVTKIFDYAFEYCSYLTSITIPESVTEIGPYAFNGCTSLTSLTSLATTPPAIYASTCRTIYKQATLYVTSEAYEAYSAAEYWANFTNIVVYSTSGSTDITSVAASTSAISTTGSAIVITTETAQTAQVYSLAGQLIVKQAVAAGETSIGIPVGGVYVVVLDDGTKAKILVK